MKAMIIAGLVTCGIFSLTGCASQEDELTYQAWVKQPASYLADLTPAESTALCQYPDALANHLYFYFDRLGSIEMSAIGQMEIQDALWEGSFIACGLPVRDKRP
jgi:hypothetical protein